MLTEAASTAVAHRLQLALIQHEAGNAVAAAEACRELLQQEPGNLDALLLLGRIMKRAARHARASLDGTAALQHDGVELPSRGPSRPEQEWTVQAESLFGSALAADPTCVEAWLGRGAALLNLGRFVECVALLQEAVHRIPDSIELRIALADAQRTQGDYAGAAETLEALIARHPEHVFAHLQLFATLYIQGDMRRGWAENEWRMHGRVPDYEQPVWDGSPLEGRSILLRAEQGLGDQVQFIRYARMVKDCGGRVICQCQPPLHRLLLSCPDIDQVVPCGEDLPPFDVQVWPGSLPHLLGTTLDTVPASVPYLAADPLQVERWRKLLAKFTELRIGINWAGNRYNLPGHNREIPLAGFFGLGRTEGVHLFSLQKGEGTDALATVPEDVRLFRMGQFFGDMYDTAAFVEAMDLVITNDTSIAHLAGALGRPVWVLLPRQACWRWRRGCADCPWYPTMRLFRQGWSSPWCDVFREVEAAVGELLAGRSSSVVRFRGVATARTAAVHA